MINLLPNVKSFEEIWNEFSTVRNLIKSAFEDYKNNIRDNNQYAAIKEFIDFKKTLQLNQIFRLLETEINRKYSFELIATFEAISVFYFKNIVKRKSQLGLILREAVPKSKLSGTKHLMLQDLADVFKYYLYPQNPILFSHIKNLIEYRNWLAHGRSWDLPQHLVLNKNNEILSEKYDFAFTFQILYDTATRLPNYPEFE